MNNWPNSRDWCSCGLKIGMEKNAKYSWYNHAIKFVSAQRKTLFGAICECSFKKKSWMIIACLLTTNVKLACKLDQFAKMYPSKTSSLRLWTNIFFSFEYFKIEVKFENALTYRLGEKAVWRPTHFSYYQVFSCIFN